MTLKIKDFDYNIKNHSSKLQTHLGFLLMKTLLLMRHAKSSWDNDSLNDYDRPLNERGKRDAPRMGEFILDKKLVPDLIISSSAKRAQETTNKIAQGCAYTGEIKTTEGLYGVSAENCINIIKSTDNKHNSLLIVGHNPATEEILAQLTDRHERIPTATIIHLEIAIKEWSILTIESNVVLKDIFRPKEVLTNID